MGEVTDRRSDLENQKKEGSKRLVLGILLGFSLGVLAVLNVGLVFFQMAHPANPQPHVLEAHPVDIIPSYAPQGHHPPMTCESYRGQVAQDAESASIRSLHRGLETETVRVRAEVVAAYWDIMGTNWYQLCDQTKGAVLIVQSDERIKVKQVVSVEGELLFDQQVAHAYTFERLIVGGKFPGAKKARPPLPDGVMEL